MGGFWDFLKGSVGEELDWLGALKQTGEDLFSLPKRGVDYLASRASGLEDVTPVEDLATNALLPSLEAHEKATMPAPYQSLYNLGRGGVKAATRFGMDPLTYGLAVPGAAGRAIAGLFGYEGAKGAIEHGEQALNAPDLPSAMEPGVEALTSAAMAGLGTRHALKGSPKPVPQFEELPSQIAEGPFEGLPEVSAGPKTIGDLNLDNPPNPREVFQQRHENMTTEFLNRIKDFAADALQDPTIKDIGITYKKGLGNQFDYDSNSMNIDPAQSIGKTPMEIAQDILHEVAHKGGLHEFGGVAPVDPQSRAPMQEVRGYIPLGEGKFAEVDPIISEHVQPFPGQPDNINERAKVSSEEHTFQTALDALKNNPDIIEKMAEYEQNQETMRTSQFWEDYEKMQKSFDLAKEDLAKVDPLDKTTSAPEQNPADVFKQILEAAKLTKFNKNTILSELAARGIPLPEEIANKVPDLIAELRDRGIANEKVAGTYTLMTGPPKATTPKPKPAGLDIEAQLKASLNKPTTTKPTVETKTPTAFKPKKSVDELVELGKKMGGEKEPPTPDYEDIGEGGAKKKPFLVTLSDGSEHTVRADTPENATAVAEHILKSRNSTKTVTGAVPKLSSLEKAAEYEIDPLKSGTEKLSEDIGTEKKAQRESAFEDKEQMKAEEKLRNAQKREKFAKKSFTVLLSTGREITVKARNEKAATEYVNTKIRNAKSSVKISSISKKLSPLDRELAGGGGNKPPDRPKFGRESIEPGDNFRQAWGKLTATEKVSEVGAIIKSLRSSGDIGHIMRQGKLMTVDLLTTGNHKLLVDALKKMGKSAFSEKEFKDASEAHSKDPVTSRLVTEFGLDLPGIAGHLKEEAFHAGTAEKIPGVGKYLIQPSERAYTSFLNEARVSEAKRLTKIAEDAGFSMDANPEVYQSLMKAVNIVGSRGDFKKIGPTLNNLSNLFWAPRLKLSRAQLITSALGAGEMHPLARAELRKSLGRTVAVNMSLLGLAALAGANVETDPRSSDWGRIKLGNTRIDPWFGLQPLVRSVALLYYGETKSSSERVSSIKPSEIAGRQLVQSLAPGPALGWEMAKGESVTGYPVDRRERAALGVSPLIVEDIYDAFKQYGLIGGIGAGATGFIGEGINTFEPKKPTNKKNKKKKLPAF